MDPEYPEAVARHFRSPSNSGPLPADAGPRRSAEAGDRGRGLWIRLEMSLAGDRVDRIGWQALACPHTLALLSVASESWPGRCLAELLPLDRDALVRAVDLPAAKRDRLLLLEDALAAIQNAHDEDPVGPPGER